MANLRPRRFALFALLLGFGLAASAGGCDCQGSSVGTVAPSLVVTPAKITFAPTAVNAEADQVVTLRNAGNDTLKITATPKVVEGTEDQKTELALRQVLDAVDCATGAAKTTGDPTQLVPGACATITVVYVPLNIGQDTGKLVIQSNDPKHAEVDVPIDATGAAPKIQVCLLPGDCVAQKTCNQPGQQMNLPFPLTP